MTAATLAAPPPQSHGADRRTLEFFGVGFTVVGEQLPDLAFQFGPHLARTRRADYQLELSAPQAEDNSRDVTVRRGDGAVMLRRPLTGWRSATPVLPPLAALTDRFAVVPGCVMTNRQTTIALIGDTAGERTRIGIGLADRGWQMVSGQLLVLDRRTGRALQFHAPLQFTGRAADRLRLEHPDPAACRPGRTSFGEPTVLIRPEAMTSIVPLHVDSPVPALVRLCRRTSCAAPTVRRRPAGPDRSDPVRSLNALQFDVPAQFTADEIADLIVRSLCAPDRLQPGRRPDSYYKVPAQLGRDAMGGNECQDAQATLRGFRVGSTA